MEFVNSDNFTMKGYNRALNDVKEEARKVIEEIDNELESYPITKLISRLNKLYWKEKEHE